MKNKLIAKVGLVLFLVSVFIMFVGAIIKMQSGTLANFLLFLGSALGIIGLGIFILGISRKPRLPSSDWEGGKK